MDWSDLGHPHLGGLGAAGAETQHQQHSRRGPGQPLQTTVESVRSGHRDYHPRWHVQQATPARTRPNFAAAGRGPRATERSGSLVSIQHLAALLVLAGLALAPAASIGCSPEDFPVTLTRFEWVDTCTVTPCPTLKAEGAIENRCDISLGARIKLRALDAAGEAVVVSQLWPFGSRNIPPGRHAISFDQWIGYDPAIVSFTVEIAELRRWR